MKSHQLNLFLAGFSHLKPQCASQQMNWPQWDLCHLAHKYHRDKLVEQLSKSGNRNFWKPKLCQSAETCFEKLVKSHQVKLFWASLSHLRPRCSSAPPQAGKWTGLSGIYATSLIKCHEDKLVEQVAKSISWLDTRQRQEETYFTFLSRMRHRH